MGEHLPVFIDEPGEFEARGDLMFIRRNGIIIAMPISVCREATARCQEALARWQVEQLDRLISFPHGPH